MALKGIGIGAIAALATLATGLAAQTASAETWDELVAAAKKEGSVTVVVGSGDINRIGRTKDWEKAFPDIKMNVLNVGATEMMARIAQEKRAGLSTIDVIFSGCIEFLETHRNNDIMKPFKEAIVDKTLLDGKNWRDGTFEAGFCDIKKEFVYSYSRAVSTRSYINWDYVKKEDLKSLDDLLKPQFNGKIAWYDPRITGSGYAVALAMTIEKGQDFTTKLFSMPSIYSTNRHQVAEWVVRGRYPIGLGVDADRMKIFQDQGLCKNCELLPMDWFKQPLATAGASSIAFLSTAPHPNAAKLYINWFLQQKQQQNWNDASGLASLRRDATVLDESIATKVGVKYLDTSSEEFIPVGRSVLELAKKTITAKAVE